VAETLVEQSGRLRRFVSGRASAPVALALFALVWSVTSYQREVEEFTAATLAGELIGFTILIAIWAGGWALGTRLSQGRGAFLEHTTWTLLVLSVSIPSSSFLGLLSFLSPGWLTQALAVIVTGSLLGLLLHVQLGVASRMGRPRRATMAVGIATALIGVVFLLNGIDPEYGTSVQGELGALYPVPAGVVPSVTTDDFLEATFRLDDRLTEVAQEG
jgi:hypothetical protein